MYGCCNNPYNVSETCIQPIIYCDQCGPIYSPITDFISSLYGRLENNYPMNRCKCNNFGVSPRYYVAPHFPCDCRCKCQ